MVINYHHNIVLWTIINQFFFFLGELKIELLRTVFWELAEALVKCFLFSRKLFLSWPWLTNRNPHLWDAQHSASEAISNWMSKNSSSQAFFLKIDTTTIPPASKNYPSLPSSARPIAKYACMPFCLFEKSRKLLSQDQSQEEATLFFQIHYQKSHVYFQR